MVKEENGKSLILKMRGLPWSATVDDIIQFLDDANIKDGKHGVHITMSREGRPSGEAFIELESADDVEKALQKNKQHMGHRYIEIFKTNRSDMERYMAESGSNVENVMDECCVRLRGLPYGCTKNDILQFFSGLTIVPNGISFVNDHTGRNSGEAYVQFVNNDMVENALKKHLDKIGHRYIEIFRSSLAEISSQTGPKIRSLMSEFVPRPVPYGRGDRYGGQNRFNRANPSATAPSQPRFRADYAETDDSDYFASDTEPLPWGRGMRKNSRDAFASSAPIRSRLSPPPAARLRNMMYGNGKGNANDDSDTWDDQEQRFTVQMRGLPYKATEQDIVNFFKPVVPIDVQIIYDKDGRPSGEATAEFETYDDANFAMSKDKQNINNRYIELFLKSTPPQQPEKATGLSGFDDEVAPDPSLFSRRTSSSAHVPVSNSAYDGFYGTSTYKSAANAGRGRGRGQRY